MAAILSGDDVGYPEGMARTSCDHELQWVVHETNAPPLWTQLGRYLSGYLATF